MPLLAVLLLGKANKMRFSAVFKDGSVSLSYSDGEALRSMNDWRWSNLHMVLVAANEKEENDLVKSVLHSLGNAFACACADCYNKSGMKKPSCESN